jgi:hypothetical protein
MLPASNPIFALSTLHHKSCIENTLRQLFESMHINDALMDSRNGCRQISAGEATVV